MHRCAGCLLLQTKSVRLKDPVGASISGGTVFSVKTPFYDKGTGLSKLEIGENGAEMAGNWAHRRKFWKM